MVKICGQNFKFSVVENIINHFVILQSVSPVKYEGYMCV